MEEGGATKLVHLGKDVSPEPGKLLVFHNTHRGTSTRHTDSYHSGCPVVKGTKWAFNLWFRERFTAGGLAAHNRSGGEGVPAQFGDWEEKWPELCVPPVRKPEAASLEVCVAFSNASEEALQLHWRPAAASCLTVALCKTGLRLPTDGAPVKVKSFVGHRWEVLDVATGEVRRSILVQAGMDVVTVE